MRAHGGRHRAVSSLPFELDTKLNVSPDATRAEVLKSIDGHVLEKGTMVGRFTGKNSEPPDPKIVAALPSPKCTESQSVHSDAMKLCLWGSVVCGGTPRYCPSNSHAKLLMFINLTLTVAFF